MLIASVVQVLALEVTMILLLVLLMILMVLVTLFSDSYSTCGVDTDTGFAAAAANNADFTPRCC